MYRSRIDFACYVPFPHWQISNLKSSLDLLNCVNQGFCAFWFYSIAWMLPQPWFDLRPAWNFNSVSVHHVLFRNSLRAKITSSFFVVSRTSLLLSVKCEHPSWELWLVSWYEVLFCNKRSLDVAFMPTWRLLKAFIRFNTFHLISKLEQSYVVA